MQTSPPTAVYNLHGNMLKQLKGGGGAFLAWPAQLAVKRLHHSWQSQLVSIVQRSLCDPAGSSPGSRNSIFKMQRRGGPESLAAELYKVGTPLSAALRARESYHPQLGSPNSVCTFDGKGGGRGVSSAHNEFRSACSGWGAHLGGNFLSMPANQFFYANPPFPFHFRSRCMNEH